MLPTSAVIVLRLIHVVLGVAWGGAVVFLGLVLLPTIKAVGPAGTPVVAHLTGVKKLPMILMTGAILTVLSGLTMYWHDSVGFSSAWMKSGPARTFGAGGVLTIIVVIMGMTINSPTARKLSRLGDSVRTAGGPPSTEQAAEMQRLQGRLGGSMRVGAILVLLAASLMAVARYMPS